ncbi:MAG TPA: glycosyltransferase family A protein [Candidatus Acidoferrum sp.]|nr:glycosyltransferase family A protein [Candidatus Acidoferrum sp.]
MKLSLIIASYNRAESLLKFLQELARQVVPDCVEWEVLIVDNNSTDGTKTAVAPFIQSMPNRYKYLFESRQGKSIALNTGVRSAAGEILVFTDDDCLPDPNWLATIAREFASDLSLSVLGGRVELFDRQDRPITIRSFPERTLIDSRDQLFLFLIGANMSIRRRALEAVGQFDPFLGPGSPPGAVMEDLDLLYRIFREKFKIVYSPDVLVYHNHGRTTDAEIQALNRRYVVGRGAFYCKHIFWGDKNVSKMAYWEISSLLKKMLKNFLSGKKIQEQGSILWALLAGAGGRLLWNPWIRKI